MLLEHTHNLIIGGETQAEIFLKKKEEKKKRKMVRRCSYLARHPGWCSPPGLLAGLGGPSVCLVCLYFVFHRLIIIIIIIVVTIIRATL